jgi:hypothetical protein
MSMKKVSHGRMRKIRENRRESAIKRAFKRSETKRC